MLSIVVLIASLSAGEVILKTNADNKDQLSNDLGAIDEHHHDEAIPHSHEDSHEHNGSKDDDCCKDKTNIFLHENI
ncbi:MAG: hypothetical protein K2U26_05200 [Cyclobacteriaceae bacterium]|nr:hypothetical protein [Cyclobacteriaceae bacterium]